MREKIKTFVLEVLSETMLVPVDDVTEETSLGDGGLELDSLSTVELIVQVENHFAFKIPEEAVDPSVVKTLGGFVDTVSAHYETVEAVQW
ncbi:acyl carrier protein [Amycolatopsis ultiminotia]